MKNIFRKAMILGLQRRYTETIENNTTILEPDLQTNIETFINWQLNNSFLSGKQFALSIKDNNIVLSKMANNPFQENTNNKTNKYELAICFSGGLDSYLALFWAINVLKYKPKDILLYHLNYGAPYSDLENQKIFALYSHLLNLGYDENPKLIVEEVNITMDESQFGKGYIIPLRNTLIATHAAFYAKNVWIVSNYRKDGLEGKDAGTVDKSSKFYCWLSELLSQFYNETTIVTSPFMHISKAESYKWYLNTYFKDEDYEPENITDGSLKTITCYNPIAKVPTTCENFDQFGNYINRDVCSKCTRRTNCALMSECKEDMKVVYNCGQCYACYKKAKMYQTLLNDTEVNDSVYYILKAGLRQFAVNPLTADNPKFEEYKQREANKGR